MPTKKLSALSSFVTPMAAIAVKQLPEGQEWLYEVKFDGYRSLIIKDDSHVQLQSRNHKNLTPMYPGIAAAAQNLHAHQVVVDGEIVALDETGRPAFQALQHRGSHPHHHILFYAFDLLHLDGRDIMGEPLEQRRALLPKLIGDNPVVRVSDDLRGSAAQVLEAGTFTQPRRCNSEASRLRVSTRGAVERLAEIQARKPAGVRDRRIQGGRSEQY